MKAYIIANGDVFQSKIDIPKIGMFIAADGGGRHCLNLGLTPDVIIGDFDSLTDQEISQLESDGVKMIQYPFDKDETDLELALDYARAQGASEITMYGMLGGRWDMTICNIMLLASPRFSKVKFHVIDRNTEMFVLRGSETLIINGKPGDSISVIPLGGDILGLSYEGLKWQLSDANLAFGSPRGVSNQFTNGTAQIKLEDGVALLVVNHLSPGGLHDS